MNKKFTEYERFNLSEINKEVLTNWKEEKLFLRSIIEREGAPQFVFYEGPPSANGMPGIHHVIARTIKDVFCRYKTMKGFQVKRKAGWDTHGLPVELGVEKTLGITKEDIGKKISVSEYNDACRKEVMKYTKEWEDLTQRMGYWVDMDNPYITYDNRYIETLWYLLKELYKKGLIYKGYTIQPYSPAAGTGLSTHELNQPGCYRDVKDTTCTAQFLIKNPKEEMKGHGEAYFLAWTTTPWTLPSNTALCVGPNIKYVAVRTFNPYSGLPITIVLAEDLMSAYLKKEAEDLDLSSYKVGDKLIPYQVVGRWVGNDLVGMEYEQLIPWVKPEAGAFRVIPGDYVTTEDGTGIVHIAPTFGADDDKVAKLSGVPPLVLIDKDGQRRPMVDLRGRFYPIEELDKEFVANSVNESLYSVYAGRFVKNSYEENPRPESESLDVDLCVMLKQSNRVFKIEKHVHNYPHCWRTDKPVLYYPLDSWFIKTTACKDRMIELNKTILWKPQSTGTGRFGKWLENLQDWNLSRSRYWGTPLPIWRTEDGSEEICIGSVEELYLAIEEAVKAGLMDENPYKDFVVGDNSKENYERIDLHRPYVDSIVLLSPKGKPMYRESDLIDVWFDSGAMPYAQLHYPFENKELIDNKEYYPADFIAEGVDQTRGWFFTLHAIATMIFDSVAFKTVVSNGLVLDKDGNKMSKRLGNAVDPFGAIEQYGSDPLRWYMITNASPWDNLKFDTEGVEEVSRKYFGTLYNTYSFFALYANLDDFDPSMPQVPLAERPEIDRWILSSLNSLIKDVDTHYSNYEPTRAGRLISDFVNDLLSNWYVRLSRKRFWTGGMGKDKLSAYQTLYSCLETVSLLMAPIAPFYAEKLYYDLRVVVDKENTTSVHLANFPKVHEDFIDLDLERRMEIAQRVSSMVLALRRKVSIKVRQPLQKIMIPVVDEQQAESIKAVEALILGEVNVKELQLVDSSAAVLVKRVKPNFKALGPRYGKIMKPLSQLLTNLEQEQIATLEHNGSLSLHVEGVEATINIDDVEIISEDIPGWLVANEGNITVALDITVTEELRKEGIARELINRIQNVRKAQNFDVVDRISVQLLSNDNFDEAIKLHKQYIMLQVQADSFEIVDTISDATAIEIDNIEVMVRVERIK